jgi:hypothetical protein
MATLLQETIMRLWDIGFFDILSFMLFSAIFYAILRKSKVLGESPLVNGVIALAAAFFLFVYPWMVGFSLTYHLVIFFAQATVWLLFIFVGILLASFFYPKLNEFLLTVFKRRSTLYAMLGIGISLLFTSGLIQILWVGVMEPLEGEGRGVFEAPQNVIILMVGVIVFIVLLLIAAAALKGE